MHVDTDFAGYDIHEGYSSGIADCYNRYLTGRYLTEHANLHYVYKSTYLLRTSAKIGTYIKMHARAFKAFTFNL